MKSSLFLQRVNRRFNFHYNNLKGEAQSYRNRLVWRPPPLPQIVKLRCGLGVFRLSRNRNFSSCTHRSTTSFSNFVIEFCGKINCSGTGNALKRCIDHEAEWIVDSFCNTNQAITSEKYPTQSSSPESPTPSSALASETPFSAPPYVAPSSTPSPRTSSSLALYSTLSSVTTSPVPSVSAFFVRSTPVSASVSSTPSLCTVLDSLIPSKMASFSPSSSVTTSAEPRISNQAMVSEPTFSQSHSVSPVISPVTVEYCLDYANTTCQISCGSSTVEVQGSLICDVAEQKCCERLEAEKCEGSYFKCEASGSCNGKLATGYVGYNGATLECCEFEPCITDGGTCRTNCNADGEGTVKSTRAKCKVANAVSQSMKKNKKSSFQQDFKELQSLKFCNQYRNIRTARSRAIH